MMVLPPGKSSDDCPSNEHPRCEQWLLVLGGAGTAIKKGPRGRRRSVKLKKESLLAIAKGELHQIKNSGAVPLRTINFYVPPAYDSEGEPLASARCSRSKKR